MVDLLASGSQQTLPEPAKPGKSLFNQQNRTYSYECGTVTNLEPVADADFLFTLLIHDHTTLQGQHTLYHF